MKTCLRFEKMEFSKGVYRLFADCAQVCLYFMSDDVVRVRASFDANFDEESYILVKTGWDDRLDAFLVDERTRVELLTPKINESDERIIFSTESLDVVVEKYPFAVRMLDKWGTELHADLAGRAYQLDNLGRIYHYSKMKENDHFYGFGEKSGRLNKNGRYMRFSPKDNLGYDPVNGDPLYKHIPFYIRLDTETKKAVGVFYHNTFESAVSMGGEISGYWDRYSYFTADGGDIDYFLISGPEIKQVVERYTELTGRTVMQPISSVGYIGSTMYYTELPERCDDEVLGFVEKAEREEVPASAFMLSSGYCEDENKKRNFFTWNEKKFPDPKNFFARMDAHNVCVAPNIKPGILKTHPLYSEMEDESAFIKTPDGMATQPVRWWGGEGAYYDFTNSKARASWTKHLVRLMSEGARGIWNDNCEYDGVDDRGALCDFEGKTGTLGQLKSVQPTLMSKMSHAAACVLDPSFRPFVICRSGSAGIQRYAQVWAGDNKTCFETLEYNIATLLGLGLSGVANCGCDIGGFYGSAPGAELFVRWVQNGIFQPRFSIHSCNSDNTVTEPWMYDGHKKYIRAAVQLRYKLVPYLYSLLREASVNGSPIMRPLFYEFQGDEKCFGEDITFMLGGSLLVANVVREGAKQREVYLPAGCAWFDFFTRRFYNGGQKIVLDVDISSIPMFVRGGSIVPLAENDALKILIAPCDGASFKIYEDDGVSKDYLEGKFLERKISVSQGGSDKLFIDCEQKIGYKSPVETIILDVVSPEKSPFWVSVGEKTLEHFLHREKFVAAREGWYYSHTLKSVQIKFGEVCADYRVTISFEKFDLLGM